MKILLVSILVTTAVRVNGQHVPYGLRETKVQKRLISKTFEFDSLILSDKASYWDEDMKITGLAFKEKQIYGLTITFGDGPSSFYDMKVKHVETVRIFDQSTIGAIRKIKFSSIADLNSDSLNYIRVDISDLHEWTILVLKGKQLTMKQSYAPDIHQPMLPTTDRKLFLDLFLQLTAAYN